MARLFTVKVAVHTDQNVNRNFEPQTVYECEFAGLHFSRSHETDLMFWVRVAATHRYGKDTQVIFLHEQKG